MLKRVVCIIVSVVLFLLVFAGCGADGGGAKTVVRLLNWGEYLDPKLLSEFNAQNDDIVVKQTTCTSNEEMYPICATEGSSIDLVVPSDYLVERLIGEGLLSELNLDHIPNFKYVEKAAKTRTFDPDSKYSVPYMMGTLGIVYNTTMVDDTVDSWDILWNEKYAKKIMMYDSIRDSMAVSLARLSYDINSTNEKELQEAQAELIKQKPIVLAYGTDDIKDSMISGSAALAMDYSGAAIAAIMENPDLEYVVPKESSNIWVYNLVVLKSSKNKEAAERFINYLCDPEVAARNSEYIGYTTPNEAAIALISDDLKNIPGYMIDDETASRCSYFKYLGESLELYNSMWMKVKTAS